MEGKGDQLSRFYGGDMPTTTTTTTPPQEIMELTWHGESVMGSSERSLPIAGSSHTNQLDEAMAIHPSSQQHMSAHEDEMTTWLQHSSFDPDLFELIYSAPPLNPTAAPPPPPVSVISPPRREMFPNFPHFTNLARLGIEPRFEPTVAEPMATTVERAMTTVGSNEMMQLGLSSQPFEKMVTCTGEGTMASTAGESFVLPPRNPPGLIGKGKGKAKETDYSQSQDIGSDTEAAEAKKQSRASGSRKRQRVAEAHNRSERKRRHKINEKIMTLKELVPGCNKDKKASILDDAIDYLKSMRLQQQMISGCGMIPNPMFPGMQQYMPARGMGVGMGMGIPHMGMGLNRPILPYPTTLPGSAHIIPADTAVIVASQALNPWSIQSELMQLLAVQSASMQQPTPYFPNPYQQHFLAIQQQATQAQTQGQVQPSDNKPGTSKGPDIPENRKPGP